MIKFRTTPNYVATKVLTFLTQTCEQIFDICSHIITVSIKHTCFRKNCENRICKTFLYSMSKSIILHEIKLKNMDQMKIKPTLLWSAIFPMFGPTLEAPNQLTTISVFFFSN